MGPPLRLTTFFLTAAGLAAASAQEPAQALSKATVFAPESVCGQVLALTVDDAGRGQAAVTTRSFGRGTLDLSHEDDLRATDRTLRSVEARLRQTRAWLESGSLESLITERRKFFPESGEGTPDFLTRYSESVQWLRDKNGDGRAETAEAVAGNFHSAGEGPGSALLALPDGRWLYGCAPDLWSLRDADGDGIAEQRKSVATGFALRHHPENHALHALLEAPDGWIYFATGDRGYAIRESHGTRRRGLGSGAIFRCRADGSALEQVASGLRNPTGLAMDDAGRLLCMDAAAPGGKSRLLLVIPGADFGWQAEAVTAPGEGLWFREGMESPASPPPFTPSPEHPQWCLPPVAAWEGTASTLEILTDSTLLAADARGGGRGGLQALKLEPQGAGFRLVETREFWRGGAVMATAQGLDGSVFLANWADAVDVFSRCRIQHLPPPSSPALPDAAGIMNLLTKQLPALPVRELKMLLEHPSPRVRLRARQRLAGMSFQESLEALLQVARRGKSRAARLHGLWGAGAVARQDPALLNELPPFLGDPDPAVRATAATMLGEGPLPDAPAALRRALTDEAPEVRLAAAAAIAHLKPPEILTDLLKAAESNTARDPWVRASLAHALACCVPAGVLAQAAPAENAEARLTVILALRRLASRELAGFLTDPDDVVRTEAARAIYDLPVTGAFPDLAAALENSGLPLPEALARRAMAAAWHLGTAADAPRVAALAMTAGASSALRLEAVDLLVKWDIVPFVEPLWNRPSRPLPRLPNQAVPALRDAVAALLMDPDPALSSRGKALSGSRAVQVLEGPAALAAVQQSARSDAERLALVQGLISRQELTPETAKILTLPTQPSAVRAEARAFLMRRDPRAAVGLLTEAFATGSLGEKQSALRTLNRLPGSGNDNEKLLLEWSRRLGQGLIETGVQVEMLEALQRRDVETRSPWRKATEAWLASLGTDTDPLSAWRMTLNDGDPAAGRLVFETHPEADCTSCHSLEGQGGIRGPDLDGVADRLTPSGLLESLIHPSAKFAEGYQPAAAAPGPEGEIQEPLSPMPPMGTALTLRELRDLMAYLKTLKNG